MGPGVVAVFTARGVVALSRDSGHTFSRRSTLSSVTSAAYRAGDGRLAVEADGWLALVNPETGKADPVSRVAVTKGSLLGDVSPQASYHALTGRSLLRYADDRAQPLPDVVGADSDFGVPPPPPGVISPATRSVRLPVGTSVALSYTLSLRTSRTPLDLALLIDRAPSMTPYLDDLKRNLSGLVTPIRTAGIDVQIGVAAFGTGPRQTSLAVAPPYVDPARPTETGSSLYRLYRRIAPVDAGLAAAISAVQIQPENGERAQLIGVQQANFGAGIKPPLVPEAVPVYLVPPNRSVAWRPDPGIRRVMVAATDQSFGRPGGSPTRPDGSLDIDQVVRELRDWEHVRVVGMTTGSAAARPELRRLAAGTHMYAGRLGADCGGGQRLAAGQPLTCDTTSDFSAVLGRLVVGLPDKQSVAVAPVGADPHLVAAVDIRALRALDVTKPNFVPFSLLVSCPRRAASRRTEVVAASMRGIQIATTSLNVQCLGSTTAAAPRRPLAPQPAPAPAAPPPVAQAPAAVPHAAPAVQPQPQPQVQPQHQVNPLIAAALQRQEDLELVGALADGSDETTLAMVNRRRQEEAAALALLASAMTACAALGLSRLRSHEQPQVAQSSTRRR